jgi:hypothetical protein
MLDDCPMTEDCPGYDRDRQTCLVHPGDCEFLPADDEAAGIVEVLDARTTEAPAEILT